MIWEGRQTLETATEVETQKKKWIGKKKVNLSRFNFKLIQFNKSVLSPARNAFVASETMTN